MPETKAVTATTPSVSLRYLAKRHRVSVFTVAYVMNDLGGMKSFPLTSPVDTLPPVFVDSVVKYAKSAKDLMRHRDVTWDALIAQLASIDCRPPQSWLN